MLQLQVYLKGIINSSIRINNLYGIGQKGFTSLGTTNFHISYGNTEIGNINILTRQGVEAENFTYATSLGVNVNFFNGDFNYLNLGSCYDSNKNLEIVSRIKEPITLMTLPHFGYLPMPEDSNYLATIIANRKKGLYFGVLVNAAWGSINNEGSSLYPSSYWGNEKGMLAHFRTNKFVNKRSKNALNLTRSYIDIEAITNYPISTKENLQYRYVYQEQGQSFKNKQYFSFYGINKTKMSDYTDTFLRTVSSDDYRSYLVNKGESK